MPRSPVTPVRAHHRLMRSIVKTNHKKDGVTPSRNELDRVAAVFEKAGGSWEGLFTGAIDDMSLLRRVIKIAAKNGYFSKAEDWT